MLLKIIQSSLGTPKHQAIWPSSYPKIPRHSQKDPAAHKPLQNRRIKQATNPHIPSEQHVHLFLDRVLLRMRQAGLPSQTTLKPT